MDSRCIASTEWQYGTISISPVRLSQVLDSDLTDLEFVASKQMRAVEGGERPKLVAYVKFASLGSEEAATSRLGLERRRACRWKGGCAPSLLMGRSR